MHSEPAPADDKNRILMMTDDEIRDRARELHEQVWVIEIPDDAQVIRPECDDECARIAAWIYLGPDD